MRDGIAEYMWEDYQNYIQDQDEEEEGETDGEDEEQVSKFKEDK